MKIKVCGMKHPENVAALKQLTIHYMGFIFYPKSPRCVENLQMEALIDLPENIKKVGVFVNESVENISQKINLFKLDIIQLHGNETVEFCQSLKLINPNIQIIKAFSISDASDILQTTGYETACDYFLFDTKTAHQYGGSGQKFDWNILNSYKGHTPLFLSGGISSNDAKSIKEINHPMLYALDLNSKFEIEAGLKDIELLKSFINEINN